MQGQRSILNTFPETVDLNQGPNSNSRGMNESDEYNSRPSPTSTHTERRLLSNDLSGELNFSFVNADGGHNPQSFSSWDIGESSSRANVQDQVANDGLNLEHNWSSSFGNHDSRFRDRQLDSSNTQLRDSFGGSQVAIGPLNMQSSGSNHIPMDVDLNIGYGGDSSNDGGHGMGFMNLYKSGSPEMEASSSSAGIGTTSELGTDSSFGNWGLSCKRKALEGASGDFFGSGSSSCFPEAENIMWHTLPNRNNGSSSISVSSSMVNSQEQINTTGAGMRGGTMASVGFPPSSVPGIPESSQRYYGMRESGSLNISSTGNPGRCSNSSSPHQSSRRLSHNEYLDQRSRGPISTSADSSHPSNQPPPLMHVPGMLRNVHAFPWSGNVNSRHGSSSSSALPRESGSESNFRSTIRNNEQHRYVFPSNETRNLVQDPTSWSLATGRASSNGGNAASSSRSNPGSCSHPSNAIWIPPLNSTTQGQQRLSEFSPWTLFSSPEAESVGQRGRFPLFPSGSSSTSEENVPSSGVNTQGRHHPPFLRSASMMEVPGDEWQAFTADIEGRHRLVSEMRQILNALRRGESLRAEDYMLFDPFINGVAELHDRHRDMRLDVDDMSYEELLALEERIGDVKTGLSEEVILKSMKQRKHITFMAISTPNLEPCCICREEYDSGDDIGTLDCGHDFHTYCIMQWLAEKNLCPICKMTGLST